MEDNNVAINKQILYKLIEDWTIKEIFNDSMKKE